MPKSKNQEDIKRPERTYTLEEKETAVQLALRHDSISSASRVLDIPHSSISNWMKKMDEDGELATIREAIRVRVADKAWSGTFKVLDSLIREHDRLAKSRGDDAEVYDPQTLEHLASIAEKMTRTLRNIGNVAQKHEMSGEVRHILDQMGSEGLTSDRIKEIGYATLGKRFN